MPYPECKDEKRKNSTDARVSTKEDGEICCTRGAREGIGRQRLCHLGLAEKRGEKINSSRRTGTISLMSNG